MTGRRLLAALVAALTAVACSGASDDPSPDAAESPTTAAPTVEGEPPGTVPDGAPETTAPRVDGETPATSPPTTSGSSDATTSTTMATSEPPAPGGVGTYAAFYLRPAESASVLVQFVVQSGAEPRGSTVDHLSDVLGAVNPKSTGFGRASIGGESRPWSAGQLRDLADAHGPPQSRQQARLTLLFLRGGFADSDTALGVAVRSDVAAIFPDRVAEAAGVLADAARIESAVTVHEVGHLLGLVDLFVDRDRDDPDHPGHSRNRESVMYWAVESTLVGDLLQGGPPREFDRADLDDLAHIRDS